MDPCGAASVIDAPLMKNIKPAADYGLPAIRMTTLGGFTPIYKDVGELDFVDDNGNNCIVLGYAQYKPLAGHKNFALLCQDILVDLKPTSPSPLNAFSALLSTYFLSRTRK